MLPTTTFGQADSMAESSSRPVHVAVCIATYRRTAGLARLLESLGKLRFEAELRPMITIVIVDNDAESAEIAPSVAAAIGRLKVPVIRLVEPTRGLAAVRNACLDHAPKDCDFIAFVDDDEWVEPQWLAALLDKQRATAAHVVQGPVRPSYLVPPPAWLAATGVYEVGPFADGQELSYGATGNVLISRAALEQSKARFHDRFNLSGGEDVDFFSQLQRAGNTIVAAPRATAHEEVPASRLNFGWAIRRRFRTGHSLGLIARHHGGVGYRLRKAIVRSGYGAAVAALGLVTSRERFARGVLDFVWGIGTLAAFTPLRVDQYSKR